MACARYKYLVLLLGLALTIYQRLVRGEQFRDQHQHRRFHLPPPCRGARTEIAYGKSFPGSVEHRSSSSSTARRQSGPTRRVKALYAKLQRPSRRLQGSVVMPDGGPFFAKNGLLFLSTEEVQKTDRWPASRHGPSWASSEPTLRCAACSTGSNSSPRASRTSRARFDQFDKPLESMNSALEAVPRRQARVLLLADPALERRKAVRPAIAQVHPDHADPRLRRPGAGREADQLRQADASRPSTSARRRARTSASPVRCRSLTTNSPPSRTGSA